VNRRALGMVVAMAIAAAAFQPFYLRVFAVNRARMAAMLVELPYRKAPGLRTFLEGVRARTRPGDAVAIAAPVQWLSAYEYICARATYVLAGREVLTLRDVGRAQFLVMYHGANGPPGFVPVWSDAHGTLLRRVR
jgi:hypothetical protein